MNIVALKQNIEQFYKKSRNTFAEKTSNMKNQQFTPLLIVLLCTSFLLFSWVSCNQTDEALKSTDGIMFAMLRNLDEGVTATDKVHGYAIMDFNPYSEAFGEILQMTKDRLGHHGYISPVNGGLYVTLADDLVARVQVSIMSNGLPKIKGISASLPDDDLRVGEDIMWFKDNGRDMYAVTSLDGTGDDILGGICIYDANTDQLVRTITDAKQLRYTHGISMFDNSAIGLVTSVVHEDVLLTGVPSVDSLGHEVSLVNFATGKVLKNYDLGTTDDGFPVAPVECAIFRKSFNKAFEGNERALVLEMVGGNLLSADWNAQTQEFDDFKAVYSPQDEKEYFPLEIYADDSRIYVTYAERVKTFDINHYAATGQLRDAGVEYITKSCAHHLAFFDATDPNTGETVPVVIIQQNLVNLGQQPFNVKFALPIELGMHEVTAYHRETGEVLRTVNIQEKYGMGIEYIGGFNENAYAHHH